MAYVCGFDGHKYVIVVKCLFNLFIKFDFFKNENEDWNKSTFWGS